MNALAGTKQHTSVEKLEYELLTTTIDDSTQMGYTTYGIRVTDEDGNTIALYPDISTSREFVAGFLNMLESRDVAAVHIHDLLEDYLD